MAPSSVTKFNNKLEVQLSGIPDVWEAKGRKYNSPA